MSEDDKPVPDDEPEAPKKKAPRRSLPRRIARGVGIAVAALILLVVIVVAWLHTGSGGEAIRGRLEARLGERVTTKLAIERVRFSLFSGIAIEGVAILDRDGERAITVDRLFVRPRIGQLLGGTISIDEAAIAGVTVNVKGRPDGTTNLTGLVKPSPPAANADAPKKDSHVIVRALAVRDVTLHYATSDGTKVDVERLSIEGDADAWTLSKSVTGALALRVETISVEKPKLAIAVTGLSAKATAAITKGTGKVQIGPTGAALRITRDDVRPFDTKLSLPSVTVDLSPDRLALALETLELAAISLASAKVEAARKDDGSFARVETARVTKLVVRAADVEALAGKPVLASDLALELSASGPPEAFTPEARITSGGGEIVLRASLDMREPKVLRYDASLTTKDFDVRKVYASEKVPPLRIGELTLRAKGERREETEPNLTATLALRDVHVRDVTIDALDARVRLAADTLTIESLELRALGQKASASGSYRVKDKTIDLALVLDARIGELLTKLRRAGVLSAPPSPLALAVSLGRPVRIGVSGNVEGELEVRVTDLDARVAGGAAKATVKALVVRGDPAKGEKPITVRNIEADLDLRSVSLAGIGRLRGKPLPVDGVARGHIRVHGDAAAPEGEVDLVVDLVSPDETRERAGTLTVKGKATGGRIEARATIVSATNEPLVVADVKAARAGKGIGAPVDVVIDVPERALGELAPLLRPEVREKLPRDARAGLHATVKGDLRTTRVEADATARLSPSAPPITLHARAQLDGPVTAASTAKASWELDLDVPETELAALPLPPERKADLAGRVAVALHAKGTRDDAKGELTVTARDVRRGAGPPADARVAITIEDDATSLAVDASLAKLAIVEGTIRASLAGRGLLAAARSGSLKSADPTLSGELRVPERAMTEWSPLLPAAEGLPGRLRGALVVGGKARDPELALAVAYSGYPTLDGHEGSLTLDARGTRERATLTLKANDAVTLSANASPKEILEARKVDGGAASVKARLEAHRVPIASLLPDSERARAMKPEGYVDAGLAAEASIVFRGDARELGALSLSGPLTIEDGAFHIPTTRRRVHHVAVRIEGDGDKVAIRRIEAKESDRAQPNRSLAIRGFYAIREREASLDVETHAVLVSGGNFGELDAPKAELTADLGARVTSSGNVRRVEVDVRSLELSSPDRQPRAVQQEVLSLGDVLEGVEVGKLPVAHRAEPAKPAGPLRPEDKTLDVVVRIPRPIHVTQRPLELFAMGEVRIERYGERRVLGGKLEATGGSILIGGRLHPLTHGEVRMTQEGPFLDLHFKREPHPAALRDFATASGADVYAHMVGPYGKQKLTFSGKADGLFEGLAVENIGRVRVLSVPDAPAGQTPQLPLVPQIRQTAYMSANLPHLAFLDRMNTYADPNAGRFAYGRFENLEAERYSKDGTRRIRTTSRPRVIGQSDAEVEGSLLFVNTRRVVSGIGILGGTRAGGGGAIFWEWSSED